MAKQIFTEIFKTLLAPLNEILIIIKWKTIKFHESIINYNHETQNIQCMTE